MSKWTLRHSNGNLVSIRIEGIGMLTLMGDSQIPAVTIRQALSRRRTETADLVSATPEPIVAYPFRYDCPWA